MPFQIKGEANVVVFHPVVLTFKVTGVDCATSPVVTQAVSGLVEVVV